MKKVMFFHLFFLLSISWINATNRPQFVAQQGHGTNDVTTIAISSDGKYVFTGSFDNYVKLWNLSNGKMMRTYNCKNLVHDVKILPDNKTILVISHDSIHIFDILSGKKNISFDYNLKYDDLTSFSKDYKTALTWSQQIPIIWDVSTGKRIKTFDKVSFAIKKAVISQDGKTFVCISNSKYLTLIDVATGKEIRTIAGHTDDIDLVFYSSDGKILNSFSFDHTFKSWDVESGNCIQTKDVGYSGRIFPLISPDGNTYVSMDEGKYKFWNLKTGKKTFSTSGVIHGFSPDCNIVITSNDDDKLYFWDVSSGDLVKTFEGQSQKVIYVGYLSDKNTILTVSDSRIIQLWNYNTGKEIKRFPTYYNVKSVAVSPDNKSLLYSYGDGNILNLDIETGKEIRNFKSQVDPIYSVSFSGDNKFITYRQNYNTLQEWDIDNCKLNKTTITYQDKSISSPDRKKAVLELIGYKEIKLIDIATGDSKELIGHDESVWNCVFSPTSNILASGSMDKTIKLWDIERGKCIQTLKGHTEGIFNLLFFDNGQKIVSASSNEIIAWDIQKNDKIFTIPNKESYAMFEIMTDGLTLFTLGNNFTYWNLANGSKIREFNGPSERISNAIFSSDRKTIFTPLDDGTIKQWDLVTGNCIRTYYGHNNEINSCAISSDGKMLVSASSDNTLKLWDVTSGKTIYTIMSRIVGGQWLVYDDEGYWDASTSGGDLVAMVNGMDCWNIDQFAVKNNRPDNILQKVGSTDKNSISHYYTQYKKRLKKLSLTESQLTDDYHVPEAKITEAIQNKKTLALKLSLSDEKYKLTRYNLFVNDVPIFGSLGKEINGNKVDISENVELTSVDNKIEVSCMNEKGAESYRALTYAIYSEPVTKNLYLLAFGVSKYQNPAYNLQFADKDALDLEKIIQNLKGKGFENVYTKVLTNEQVTPEAIKAAKDFVKNAKPDDTFILFIAGHGMHDKDAEATYYYLTSNADVNNLKATAADFETIEDLLQGIPPRNKLFLMDACESGEIDEEDQGQMLTVANGAGINSRGFKTTTVQPLSTPIAIGEQPATKRSYLFQKDRYIYNDLARRSGAIVFSSSKGGELSYERSDIENGLFTEYIMKALTTTEADKDNNGTVSTDELRSYVSEQVAKASGDLQHPTVDRDNIYQKFSFAELASSVGFGVK